MNIDNGRQVHLEIADVFDGKAGVASGFVSFVPNLGRRRPNKTVAGVMDGETVILWPVKDVEGPFWTARYEMPK